MSTQTTLHRRSFYKAAVTALTAAATLQTAASYGRVIGANDKVRLGFLGVANRGQQDIGAFCQPYGNRRIRFATLLIRKNNVTVVTKAM